MKMLVVLFSLLFCVSVALAEPMTTKEVALMLRMGVAPKEITISVQQRKLLTSPGFEELASYRSAGATEELIVACQSPENILDPEAVFLDRRRKLNVHSVAEVTGDIPTFDRKDVSIEGEIQLSDYFNYEFRDRQSSFFSFSISDASSRYHVINVYFPRGKAQALRDELIAAAGKPLRAIIQIQVSRELMKNRMAMGVAFHPANAADGPSIQADSKSPAR